MTVIEDYTETQPDKERRQRSHAADYKPALMRDSLCARQLNTCHCLSGPV
jgi:hypothetical protein